MIMSLPNFNAKSRQQWNTWSDYNSGTGKKQASGIAARGRFANDVLSVVPITMAIGARYVMENGRRPPMGNATVKCNGCGEVSDAEDIHCRCADMQVKTISVPVEIAQRFEDGVYTKDDVEWLRRELANTWPDWIF
jgi:hypothetical protein